MIDIRYYHGCENTLPLLTRKREQIPAWRKRSNYPYAVARIGAMKSRLIPRDMYNKLLNMSLPEIARFMEESEYRREIDELAVRFSGIDLLELALNLNLARTFKTVLGFSEGELAFLVSSYLKRWDAWSIKCIIRGKYYGASIDEILQTIIPAGDLTIDFLIALAKLDSIDEIIERLRIKRSIFYAPLAAAKEQFDQTKMLSFLEDSIDKAYYSTVMEDLALEKGFVTGLLPELSRYSTISSIFSPRSLKMFMEFFRTEIDVVNLKTLFRLKREDLEAKEVMKYMIEGGIRVRGDQLEKMAGAKSFKDFLDLVSQAYPGNEIEDAIATIETTGSLSSIEIALEKVLIGTGQMISYEFPLSVAPVLWYMVKKNAEVYNLRVIARGKETMLSTETIKKQLVI